MLQFYNLVDVLDECARKTPSPYIAELIASVYDMFKEFFEMTVKTLKDKDKLKLLCNCAISLIILLTETRRFDEALQMIALVCQYEVKLGLDRTCASYLLLIRDSVNVDAPTNVLMLQSVFLKYNSDYNDLVRAYIGAMAFFRRYEQIEQAVQELVESGDRDAADFI